MRYKSLTSSPVAIDRIPEDIYNRPHSEIVNSYLAKKYGKYGFRKTHPILYNPEWKPEPKQQGVFVRSHNRYRWVENVSDGLRFIGASHDIIRLNHTGWYNDNFQNETIHGEVYQMPARDGVPQFIPAVNDPCNDNCAILDFHGICDSKEDAARGADQMAEHQAESEREYQAEEDAKNRLSEIADEIKKLH